MKSFASSESGAVTVDWVVLTAALVGLGLAVMGVVSNGIEDLSTDTSDALTNIELTSAFDRAVAALRIQDEGAIHGRHGGGWMEGTVADWSDPAKISDTNLASLYTESATFVANQQTNGITNQQEYETRLDYLGAAEAAMTNRGMDTPGADTNYTTALTNFRNG